MSEARPNRGHQLTIHDDLWQAYGCSGAKIREALRARREEQAVHRVAIPPAKQGRNGSKPTPWGTLFFAAKVTPCPLCSGAIHPTMLVVATSWTKRLDTRVERGASGVVHLECAKRNGIEVRWTVERILGDLRKIIASIPQRKLQKRAA